MRGLFLFLFFTPFSYLLAQGHVVRNGGDAVVCYADNTHSKIVSIDLFDHWELSHILPPNTHLNLGPEDYSVIDKINIALTQIERFDFQLAQMIRNPALSIAQNIEYYLADTEQIIEVDDENPQVVPENNCLMQQFAIQIKNTSPGDRRFLVSRFLYNHPLTTNTTRAGLILHEAIYRYAVSKGHTDSQRTRTLNYLFSSTDMKKMSLSDYHNYLSHNGIADTGCESTYAAPFNEKIYVKKTEPGKEKFLDEHRFCYNTHQDLGNLGLDIIQNSIITSLDLNESLVKSFPTFFLNNGSKITYRSLTNLPAEYTIQSQPGTPPASFSQSSDSHYILDLQPQTTSLNSSSAKIKINVNNSTLDCDWNARITFYAGSSSLIHSCYMQPSLPAPLVQHLEENLAPVYVSVYPDDQKIQSVILDPLHPKELMTVANKKLVFKSANFSQENGKVTSGYVVHPIQVFLQSKMIALEYVEFNQLGQIKISSFDGSRVDPNRGIDIAEPQFQGKRLIYEDPTDLYDIKLRAYNVCHESINIPHTKIRWFDKTTTEEYIPLEETFYNLATGSLVTKNEEYAKMVDTLWCGGDFYIYF